MLAINGDWWWSFLTPISILGTITVTWHLFFIAFRLNIAIWFFLVIIIPYHTRSGNVDQCCIAYVCSAIPSILLLFDTYFADTLYLWLTLLDEIAFLLQLIYLNIVIRAFIIDVLWHAFCLWLALPSGTALFLQLTCPNVIRAFCFVIRHALDRHSLLSRKLLKGWQNHLHWFPQFILIWALNQLEPYVGSLSWYQLLYHHLSFQFNIEFIVFSIVLCWQVFCHSSLASLPQC
jgi:hypothetical protein